MIPIDCPEGALPPWSAPTEEPQPAPANGKRDLADATVSEITAAWDSGEPLADEPANEPGAGAGAGGPATGGPTIEPFPLYTLDDEEPQPTEWLIGGLLPEESCVVVGAEEKTGKTFLLYQMALALAVGGFRVLGRFEARRQGTVLCYSPESGRKAQRRRLWALCRGLGIDPWQALGRIPHLGARLDLARADMVERLRATVRAVRPVLVVVDPLIAAHLGLDENSSGDVQPVLDALRGLVELSPGMTVVVAHHLAKGRADRSAFHGLRGSSALGAWSDGLITIARENDDRGAARRVSIIHRDEESPDPAGFRIASTADPERPGLSSLRLEPCDPPILGKTRAKADFTELRGCGNKIATMVKTRPGFWTVTALATSLKLNKSTISRAIKELRELGIVRVDDKHTLFFCAGEGGSSDQVA